ncbi:MAG: hypothetical protein WC783_04270 [Candidatus Paceibacterota bacterium]|jgi:hypothetical protein
MELTFTKDLGIKAQSEALLALLTETFVKIPDNKKGSLYSIQTRPWYNGRETGYALLLLGTNRVITFGENRNSDTIFVDVWLTKMYPFNPPTIDNYTEEDYQNRKFFGAYDFNAAIEHIVESITKIYEEAINEKPEEK